METIDPVSKPSMPHSVAEPKFVRLQDYRLDDNLTCDSGRILISGTQALVRLTLMQARLDRARGWNTAGFVSGYRGSPWGQWIRHCGRRRPYWTKTRCASCRRSTKSWARRPHWEPSGWPVTRCDALRSLRNVVRQGAWCRSGWRCLAPRQCLWFVLTWRGPCRGGGRSRLCVVGSSISE